VTTDTRRVTRTDTERVIDYFREHEGASRAEAQRDLGWIHVTARMSDARRDFGITFAKWRDDQGVYRFRIVEPKPVTHGESIGMFGS
jgi:hypothetical protein